MAVSRTEGSAHAKSTVTGFFCKERLDTIGISFGGEATTIVCNGEADIIF